MMKNALAIAVLVLGGFSWFAAFAQMPPSEQEISKYDGLHAAAHRNDAAAVSALLKNGAAPDQRDGYGRTAVHIAAHAGGYETLRALVAGGADIKAFDADSYDVITIAAVRNDVRMVRLAVELGGDPKAVTSPYDGTALIAAAHLGFVDVVKALIAAGAPLDHVNNLGWTALIEAVILGDGGAQHIATVRALVDAGADKTIADREGVTPLKHAQMRGYAPMVAILK